MPGIRLTVASIVLAVEARGELVLAVALVLDVVVQVPDTLGNAEGRDAAESGEREEKLAGGVHLDRLSSEVVMVMG